MGTTTRTLAMAGMLMATGCWPYISQYDPGDELGAGGGGGANQALREDATLIGSLSRRHFLGTYWSDDASEDSVWASMAFVEPVAWRGHSFYGGQTGGCWSNPDIDEYDIFDPGVDEVTLTNGGDDWDVRDTGGGVFSRELDSDFWASGERYGLSVDDSDELGSLEVDHLTELPRSFDFAGPVDLDGAEIERLGPDELVFDFDGNKGDFTVLQLLLVNNDSGQTVETVNCVYGGGQGRIEVPEDVWDDWDAGYVLYIQGGTVIEGYGDVPETDGRSAVTGEYWVQGAALTQD